MSSTLDPKPFTSSQIYVFFDQYRIIVPEMVQNLGLTLIAVLVICTFILVHPLSVLILLFVLATIFVDLLGSINLWGLDLNSISAVNLVMAIGLVVDYSRSVLHIEYTHHLACSMSRTSTHAYVMQSRRFLSIEQEQLSFFCV
jgi:Niemann-Pick C1 protein